MAAMAILTVTGIAVALAVSRSGGSDGVTAVSSPSSRPKSSRARPRVKAAQPRVKAAQGAGRPSISAGSIISNPAENMPAAQPSPMRPLTAWAFVGSCYRGTGTAMYDYAMEGHRLLGLPYPHFFCIRSFREPGTEAKFQATFGHSRVTLIDEWPRGEALDELLQPHNVSHVYMLKSGQVDGVLSKKAMNLVHAVFMAKTPHGDRYAKVSSSVKGDAPVVPHMVRPLPSGTGTSRRALNISSDAVVLCRYGGRGTFNIKYVHKAVVQAVARRDDLHFLFVNTDSFGTTHPRIRFLPALHSDEEKARFIRSCDAMLHARREGETFGLAVAEFAMLGKRIITEDSGANRRDQQFHLTQLGESGIIYHNEKDVLDILLMIKKEKRNPVSAFAYSDYTPYKVMRTFLEIFLT